MPLRFFQALRAGGLKPSLQEYLQLLAALRAEMIEPDLEQFHSLARLCLIKDEALFDRFDLIFKAYLDGLEKVFVDPQSLPEEWLRKIGERTFSEAELKAISESWQGQSFDELMRQLKERLAEQKARHQGGNRYIGSLGTSPFGHSGFNPHGVRIGGEASQGRAGKVWEARLYKDYADDQQMGIRESQLALRKLRKFARTDAQFELDLDDTIRSTARNAGWLDVKMQRQRRNDIKVLLLLDVGGSMDEHSYRAASLFSAAKSEFKHLEYFYFHNCIYSRLWKNNARRKESEMALGEVLHKFDSSWKMICVGDASMSPYEILSPGGSVEHWNDESGELCVQRLLKHYPRAVWLNPSAEAHWQYTPSIQLLKELFSQRMFAMTLSGLESAMRSLRGHSAQKH